MSKVVQSVPGLGPIFEGWVSPGTRAGNFVFVAGLIGCDAKTGKILTTGAEAQIRRIFEEMELILKAHGADLQQIVKMTMYFTDRKRQWPIFDRIRREIFPKDPPSTTGVGVTELEQGAEVEIEAIAFAPE